MLLKHALCRQHLNLHCLPLAAHIRRLLDGGASASGQGGASAVGPSASGNTLTVSVADPYSKMAMSTVFSTAVGQQVSTNANSETESRECCWGLPCPAVPVSCACSCTPVFLLPACCPPEPQQPHQEPDCPALPCSV